MVHGMSEAAGGPGEAPRDSVPARSSAEEGRGMRPVADDRNTVVLLSLAVRTLALIRFPPSGCSISCGSLRRSHQPGPFVHLRTGSGMNRDQWLTVEQAEILAEELTLLISELESDISRLVNIEYERLTKHLLPGV